MAQSYLKSGHEQYRKVQAQTGSRADLVLMLYQGAIRFMNRALAKLDAEDIEGTHNALIRAQQILNELKATLNHAVGGEISSGLDGVYDYCVQRLIDANVSKEADPVLEVKQLIQQIAGAWEEALQQAKDTRSDLSG